MTLRLNLPTALESRLRAEASARGEDIETFVVRAIEERLLSGPSSSTHADARPSVEEFDAELSQLTFDGPTLPGDFSRADIYIDHD